MATITMQRDLVVALKKETVLNVGILSKLQTMPPDLARQVFKENALDKPTQTQFNHLSHYLVCIIDSQASTSLSWPLYDTKTERAYRNELSSFISDYSNKGLLAPVVSSYLVNPGCFKVTKLLFQLSQLAVQKLLTSKMKKESQKKLHSDMTEKFKSQEKEGFLEQIEKETQMMLSKFSIYLYKRKIMEKIAGLFRKKISEMESQLLSSNAQNYLDELVNSYVRTHTLDDVTKAEILLVKNVHKPSKVFDSWLSEIDRKIDRMESKWSEKVLPLLQICKDTQYCTESLIARHTGEADKSSYMIEYNHKTDEICTNDLQNQVNSQQKYILKNIIKDERLNFPNLIRGFLIAICFVLKNAEIGDEIYKFNEYLDGSKRNYNELVKALRELIERVMNAEAKLETSPVSYNHSVSIKDYPEMPLLPDLSDLRCTKELQCQVQFESFTPLSMSKHQFNLRRKTIHHKFAIPQAKSLFVTPFNQAPKHDFMTSVISCRISSYDRLNTMQNCHDMSVISQSNKGNFNETIAECSSGFTKQQISRLLSVTKKSSSSKKFKYKTERPESLHIKKGDLFNESKTSNDSNGLFRSYSSPNLFENREKRPIVKAGRRKLSVMREDSPVLLEVSGIAALDRDSSCETSKSLVLSTGKLLDAPTVPIILVTPESEQKFHEMVKDFNIDLNKEIFEIPKLTKTNIVSKEIEPRIETPKTNTQLIRKTSSLEKIINRFKKVRANVVPEDLNETTNEFRTIVEERDKENTNVNVDVFTANRILLPDLLSPNCSKKSIDYMDQIWMDVDEKVCRRPRESLGTALGVDQTILDEFDLID